MWQAVDVRAVNGGTIAGWMALPCAEFGHGPLDRAKIYVLLSTRNYNCELQYCYELDIARCRGGWLYPACYELGG